MLRLVGALRQLVSGGPRVVSVAAKNRLTLGLEGYRAKTKPQSEQGSRPKHSRIGKCGPPAGEMPRLETYRDGGWQERERTEAGGD